MSNLKKLDKIIYIIILILGIITASILVYFTLIGIMNIMNSMEFSKILINMKIYSYFYKVLNRVNSFTLPMLLIIFICTIPYLILSLILTVIFITKYVKYREKKKNRIIKTVILSIVVAFIVIKGISLYPISNHYEIQVNSKISEISNIEVRDFLQERLDEDKYIYKIEIETGFPDDYDIQIYYRDVVTKVRNSSLSDSEHKFIENNAKELTNSLAIKSILLMVVGDGLYIYFLVYILREFKIISEQKYEGVQQESKRIKEKGKSLPLKIILHLLILIIFIIVLIVYVISKTKMKKASTVMENTTNVLQHTEETVSDDILYEKRVDDNIIIRVVYKGAVLAQRSIIGIKKSTDGGISWKEHKEDLQIHNGAEFVFLDENLGFINDPGLAGTDGENRGLMVTTNGGKTFVNANIIHPSKMTEKNLFVSGLPYWEDGQLKIKIYTINYQKNPAKTYYEFYSEDNGLNWKCIEN